MSDWGITTKVPAEVVLAEGIALAGDLHLYARTTYPPGPETPLEMLNRPDTFFALTVASEQPREEAHREARLLHADLLHPGDRERHAVRDDPLAYLCGREVAE